MKKTKKRILSFILSLALVVTSLSAFEKSSSAAELVQDTTLQAVSNLKVFDYSAHTGKYLVYFDEAEVSAGYNIYIDSMDEAVKTVENSGGYLTAKELEEYGTGTHTMYVTNLGENNTQSAPTQTTFTITGNKGSYSNIAQIYIYAKDEITKEYQKGVAVSIVDKDGGEYEDIIDASTQIKIRGNSTADAPKKPWNIKLDSKEEVFGMPKGKKWCILANAFDKSLMRNSLSYDFASEIGVTYTGESHFVDVYLNGTFQGNYLITEPVDPGTGRVEIDPYNNENDEILLELGTRYEEGVDHFTTSVLETTFDVNAPEKGDDLTDEQVDAKISRVKTYLDGFERALQSQDYNRILEYIDEDTFVNFYITNEYFKNVDFNFSSTRFYIKGNKIYAGPLWDLDLSSGNCSSSFYTDYYVDGVSYKGYYCQQMTWYSYLMQNETFVSKVKARYKELQYKIQNIYKDGSETKISIDYLLSSYGESFQRNYASTSQLGAGWPLISYDNGISYSSESGWTSWDQPIEFLRDWLENRNEWLCDQWGVDIVNDYVEPDDSSEILEGITGYDVELAGLAWENESGSSDIVNGDRVTFTAAIKNTSNVDIPAGIAIGLKVSIDGSTNLTNITYKDGLKAGQVVRISPIGTWSAVKGGHTVEATVDYADKLPDELTEDNNMRTKSFNVKDGGPNTSYVPVTGGYDIQVLDISYNQDAIAVGDELRFSATIVNAGDTTVPSGKKVGLQFMIDSQPYPSPITWCDTYYDGLEPGEIVTLTANGGNVNTNGMWTAESGMHTITAVIDDTGNFAEVNENNNTFTISVNVPYGGVTYIENPDEPDDLDSIVDDVIIPEETTTILEETTTIPEETTTIIEETTTIPEATESETTPEVTTEIDTTVGVNGYDLEVTGLSWANEAGLTDIYAGDIVTFTAAITNSGDEDIPAGMAVELNVKINGVTELATVTFEDGIKAGKTIKVSLAEKWSAEKGGYTVEAVVDPSNILDNEKSEDNNTRTKSFNVEDKLNTDYTPVTGGYDLVVTDIKYNLNSIEEGSNVIFSAVVVNAGNEDVPANEIIGVRFHMNNNQRVLTWSDQYTGGLKAGEAILLTANGGTNGNSWSATEGEHTVTAWVDDVNRFTDEVDEDNNQARTSISVPLDGVEYVENPDQPDDLSEIGEEETTVPEITTTVPETTEPETTTEEVTTEPETTTQEETTTEEPVIEETTTEEVTTEASKNQYTVTVDGEVVATVEEGETYTFPKTAKVGYYSDGKLYKKGSSYIVTNNVEFSAVDITAGNGASIKWSEPSGMRFSASISSSNSDVFDTAVIKTGMLIAPYDFYSEDGILDFDSEYVFLNVENNGWTGTTGTFGGALASIASDNYNRYYVARAYVTVEYADGSEATVYSNMTGSRSIKGIATTMINTPSIYDSLSTAQKTLLNSYISE